MKQSVRFAFILLMGGSLFGAPMLHAQRTSDTETSYRGGIDSIVQSLFQQFDEKFGTSIFSSRESLLPDVDTSFSSFHETESSSFHRSRTRHSISSLYARGDEIGIMRSAIQVPQWQDRSENLLLRYNRVEGLFLGWNYPERYDWNNRRVSLFGSGGYGFAAHRWRYDLGVGQNFGIGGHTILGIGIEGHSLTDTKDEWIVATGENTIASLVTRDDYRDYFGREGVSAWVGMYQRWRSADLQLRASFLNDQYESLSRHTNWSVFGGDKLFRDNPYVKEGRMKSLAFTLNFHDFIDHDMLSRGWGLAASAEAAGKWLGGEFDFNNYIVDIRRYQPLSDYDNINLRLRAASGTGDLPPQRLFEIGGFGTLPAFSYKEFSGNRMLLANAEYIISGRIIEGDIPVFSWFLHDLTLILFSDAGFAATAGSDDAFTKGFNSLSTSTIRSDWGFGIGTRDAKVRLGFAWRTDVAEPVKVFLRLDRPF